MHCHCKYKAGKKEGFDKNIHKILETNVRSNILFKISKNTANMIIYKKIYIYTTCKEILLI